MALPWMITCDPMSVVGLSNTGFMSVCGANPQAWACTAWARPISPPSAVTAELSAMFCGLKGATDSPWRFSQRHSAVTSVLLPASDVVPCTIRVVMNSAPQVPRPAAANRPRPGADRSAGWPDDRTVEPECRAEPVPHTGAGRARCGPIETAPCPRAAVVHDGLAGPPGVGLAHAVARPAVHGPPPVRPPAHADRVLGPVRSPPRGRVARSAWPAAPVRTAQSPGEYPPGRRTCQTNATRSRSEERSVGKECRSPWRAEHGEKNEQSSR